jgi:hypothetical protein
MSYPIARVVELALRWHVALSMFVYGIAKTVQFDATVENDAPVNSLTGQELMWAFYGYSLTYAKFLGAVEMGGAVLLLFRRTTLLGCLVLSTVLVNVLFQDIVFGVNAGALRAAVIYQSFTLVIVGLNNRQVASIWRSFTERSRVPKASVWIGLAAGGVLALTLAAEHWATH